MRMDLCPKVKTGGCTCSLFLILSFPPSVLFMSLTCRLQTYSIHRLLLVHCWNGKQSIRSSFRSARSKALEHELSTWKERESHMSIYGNTGKEKISLLAHSGWLWLLLSHYSVSGKHWCSKSQWRQSKASSRCSLWPRSALGPSLSCFGFEICACPYQSRLKQARPNLPPPDPPSAKFCICGFGPAVALVARSLLNTAVAALPLGKHTRVLEP